jgi:hypothetical protein
VCLIRRLWFFGLCINRLPVVTVSLTAKYLQYSALFSYVFIFSTIIIIKENYRRGEFTITVSQKHCLL